MENRDQYVIEAALETSGEENITRAVKKMGDLKDAANDAGEAMDKQREKADFAADALDQVTGGMAGMFKNMTRSIKDAFPALQGLKGAIVATGIGALVVAVGILAANWESVNKWLNSASDETNKMVEDANALAQASQASLDAISATENILKLQGKSEGDILKMKMAQTDEAIAAHKIQLEALKQQRDEQIAMADRNQKIAKGILTFLTAPIQVLLGAVDALTAGLAKVGVLEAGTNLRDGMNTFVAKAMGFDPEAVAAEADATIAETEKALTALQNTRAGYELTQKANDKAAADAAAAKAKADKEAADAKAKEAEAAAKDLAAKEAAAAKEKADAIQKIEDELWMSTASDIEKEVRAIEDKYNALEALAVQHGQDTVALEAARMQEIAALEERARLAKKEADDKARADQDAKDQEAHDKMIERRHAGITKGFELAQAGADLALTLLEQGDAADARSARKRFERAKKIQLAAAVMSTAQAIIASLAAPPVGLGYPAGLAGAVTAGITGAASIASIRGQQFDGGDSSTPPSVSSMSQVAQNAPVVDLGFMNQGSVQQEPVRAYVLEQQVTNTQQTSQLLREQSQL